MGRLYRASRCIEHLTTSRKNPAPTLEITLYNMLGEKIVENMKIPIDTGYEGPIMLTSELYETFMKAELPRTLWRTYKTLSGTIVMRTARAVVKIADMELETFVETPFFGSGKLLMGREIINKLTIIIDGKKQETCIAEMG